MNQDIVITLLQKMFILTLEMSVPILVVGVILGLIVSIFQTVTQIQESTLTFVPKIVGCVLLLIFLLPWMFSVFLTTVNEFMDMIPQLIGVV
ncbi:flagellar biosynthetic protein FliQ [bacterium]|nr:flagellar biosynthetic protein FliQ [bacterium]MBR1776828.1 flagellar biosynthetic protein FliQ [bacterium]